MSEIDRVFTNRFLQACQNANLDKVKTLANQYRINNWTAHRHSATGDTALHVAAREGNIDVVKYLCEDWTEPEYIANVANFDMKRPLHEAAQFARSDVLQYLIQQGANVDALKRADWTPLMLACTKKAFHGCHNILDVLLTAKPDLLHSRDSAGSTPLHESVKSLNFKVTEYLLKQGANIKVIDV